MNSEFAIINKKEVEGRNVLIVDTKKATYQGRKWKDLSDFQKRKLENLVFLNNAKDRPKIVYL